MIRSLLAFLIVVTAMFFAGLYLAYGKTDPCQALAVEEARRSPAPTAMAKLWTRVETSGMGSLSCSRALVQSWHERITR